MLSSFTDYHFIKLLVTHIIRHMSLFPIIFIIATTILCFLSFETNFVASSLSSDFSDNCDDTLSSAASSNRPSPSQFLAYKTFSSSSFSVSDDGHQSSQQFHRSASSLGSYESNILRTSGLGCHQWPGSQYTCDMCCNGNCCEDPQFWNTNNNNNTLEDAQIWIPIRLVYVIASGTDRSVIPSEERAKQLFARVNTAFARFPYRFLLTSSEIMQNDTVHQHCATDPCFTDANCGFLKTLIPAMKFDTDREIVVTVCDGIKYLGESQFPWGAPPYQYVELQLKTFADQFPYIVHELGHYTGLMHVFEGACGSRGDWVEDTPAAARASASCFSQKDTCPSNPGKDDVTNFMNYGLFWECGLHFTEGQRRRSIQAMEFYRPSLIANTRVMLNENNARPDQLLILNKSATDVRRIPACSVTAATFDDCWCEYPELDPKSWCKEIASNGTTFNAGVTLSPPTAAPPTGFLGFQQSTVLSSVILAMGFFILLSLVAVHQFGEKDTRPPLESNNAARDTEMT